MGTFALVNPKKRKSKGRRVNIKSKRRSHRRNPISVKSAMGQFANGAIGAAGALAVDVLMQKLPIPENLKTGNAAPLVQGAVGIALGMIVDKVLKKKALGSAMANGSIVVALYKSGRQVLAPTLGLNGFDDSGMLGFEDNGMLGWDMKNNDLGYTSPAPSFADYQDVNDSWEYN